MNTYKIQHDPRTGRFEVILEDSSAHVQYRIIDRVLVFLNVMFPDGMKDNEGIVALLDHVARFAQDRQFKIVASCPTSRRFFEQHTQYSSLIVK